MRKWLTTFVTYKLSNPRLDGLSINIATRLHRKHGTNATLSTLNFPNNLLKLYNNINNNQQSLNIRPATACKILVLRKLIIINNTNKFYLRLQITIIMVKIK